MEVYNKSLTKQKKGKTLINTGCYKQICGRWHNVDSGKLTKKKANRF